MTSRRGDSLRAVRWQSLRRLGLRCVAQGRVERHRLMLGLGGSLGLSLVEIARPWPLKLLFDFILLERVADGHWAPIAQWIAAHREAAVVALCASMLLIATARETLGYMQNMALAGAAYRIVNNLRCRLYAHLQRLSLDFHATSRTGDLLMRLTGDVRLFGEMLAGSLPTLLGVTLLLIGTATIMLIMDPLLALTGLAILPLLALSISRLTIEIRRAVGQQRRHESILAAGAHEALIGLRIVQAFGRERDQTRRFERQSRKNLTLGLRARRLQAALQRRTLLLLAVAVCLVLGVGAWRVRTGVLSPGDLLVFLAYLESLQRPVARLSRTLGRLSKAAACGDRILAVLDRTPRVEDAPDAITATGLRGAVTFERVTFGYERAGRALRRVTFHVEAGESIALVGASGAGKTTIFNLLLRFYDPRRGRVLIDGTDLRRFTLTSLREQLSPVMQEPLLFGATMHENLAFGRPDASRAEVEEAARRVGLDRLIDTLPDGYDTHIGEGGASLSGGQRQLVSIARAVLRDSPIMVIDEPSSGLDVETEQRVTAALESLTAARTTFFITHRFTTILGVDRILVMQKGELIAEGRHPELYRSCSRYRKLCDLQFGGEDGMRAVRRLQEERDDAGNAAAQRNATGATGAARTADVTGRPGWTAAAPGGCTA